MAKVTKVAVFLSKVTAVYIPFTPGYDRRMKILFCMIVSLCAVAVSAEEPAPRQKIPIPKPFLVCETDADCDVTVELCGCCAFTPMNKRSVRKYAALSRYCKEGQPMCKCADPGKTAKCVKKYCELVPKK